MNRLGWSILAILIIAAGCFALLVRGGRHSGGPSASPVVATASVNQNAAPLAVPVGGVPAAQLVDSFADPRANGRTHGAIDILAPKGAPVLAAAPGRIEKLYESQLGGHTLYERAADGRTELYYAHLDGYAPGIAEGMAVQKGQIIATVGSTGDADERAPHLHFEVHRLEAKQGWWQGSSVDPYPLLTGRMPPQ